MHRAVRECGFDGVRAFGEEPAGFLPLGAPRQLAGSNNPGGPFGERFRPGSWRG
jgi:hypothetical protein